MSSQKQKSNPKLRDPDFIGAEAALRRAAERARRRAAETTGTVAVYRDGKIVQEEVGKDKPA